MEDIKTITLQESGVLFDEEQHTYSLDGKQLVGITKTLIHRAFPDAYADIPEATLMAAAAKGKALHEQIRIQDMFDDEPSDPRVKLYYDKKQNLGWTTVANEYLITDRERYASSIDIVLQDSEGGVILADIKTTYDLHCDMVQLQLSIYKKFFEAQNPDLKVKALYALWMPNKDHNICQAVSLTPVDEATIDALIQADIDDKPFDYKPENTLPAWLPTLEDEYAVVAAQYDAAKARLDEIKSEIMKRMEENDLKSVKTGRFSFAYVAAKNSQRFDSKAFKADNPDEYNKYMKDTPTAASIRITAVKAK